MSFVCLCAWAWPVRTRTLAGSSGAISLTSWRGETPWAAAIWIVSSLPCLLKTLCAVAVEKTAIVAPPSEETPPNLTVPAILKRSSGPRATTPICCPIEKWSLLAVAASMSTSAGPLGQVPFASVSGLKRWAPGW